MFLFAFLVVSAQLQKGQWMLGGNASFSNTTSNASTPVFNQHSKQTSYTIFPSAGYFFIDRLAAGLRVNATNVKSKTEANSFGNPFFSSSSAELKASGLGVGAFVRYYLLTPKNKFNIFAEAAFSHNKQKSRSTEQQVFLPQGGGGVPTSSMSYAESEYKTNDYSFAAGPVLFISPRVSFELTVGYTSGKVTKQSQFTHQISVGTGFYVFLGK
jgi:hypothetical protein